MTYQCASDSRLRRIGIGLVLLVVVGCKRGGEATSTTPMEVEPIAKTCIVIHGPAEGAARNGERIDISWDSKRVFSEIIPIRKSGPDGMPVEVLRLASEAGRHVLEIDYAGQKMRVDVILKEGEQRHFMLFGLRDGQPVLIEDMGNNPVFI